MLRSEAVHLRGDTRAVHGSLNFGDVFGRSCERLVKEQRHAATGASEYHPASALDLRANADQVNLPHGQGFVQVVDVRDLVALRHLPVQGVTCGRRLGVVGDGDDLRARISMEGGRIPLLVGAVPRNQEDPVLLPTGHPGIAPQTRW